MWMVNFFLQPFYFLRVLILSAFSFIFWLTPQSQTSLLNSEQAKALAYIDLNSHLVQSIYWPNVKPASFIKNIRKNVLNPIKIYAGSNTNFCAYAALSYTCINAEPLLYVEFMINLYNNGSADFRKIHFNPSIQVKDVAGLLKFKGELDVNVADQIWFLTLADRFKGYLNYLSFHYKTGAENTLWPATNFSKFNRMLRKLTGYKVQSIGADLIRPRFNNIGTFLQETLAENDQVFLYLNNAILYKKNHQRVKFRFPTHFVVLFSIEESSDSYTLVYWDYGYKTQLILPVSVFKDIVFGITWCKKQMTP